MASDALTNGDQLYNKVKSLVQDTKPLDENTARIIVESVDDAIKEFGNTKQEKKVELRKWREQAESALPPGTIEELRKRAEGQILKTAFPRTRLLRNVLLWSVGTVIIVAALMAVFNAIAETGLKGDHNPSAAATTQQSPIEEKTTEPVHVAQRDRRDNVNHPALTPADNSDAGDINNSSVSNTKRVAGTNTPIQRTTPQPPTTSNLSLGSPGTSAAPLFPKLPIGRDPRYRSERPTTAPSPLSSKPRQFTKPPIRTLMGLRRREPFTAHSNGVYGRFYANWNTNPEAAYEAAIEFIEAYPGDEYARYVRRYIKEYERQIPKN